MTIQEIASRDLVVESKEDSDSSDLMGHAKIYGGTVIGFSDGRPLLLIKGRSNPLRAIAQSIHLTESDIGKSVAVIFDCGDDRRPMVIGELAESFDARPSSDEPRVEIVAEEELVLKCGKTTIKMSADGTISLRGANVISRASHTNRIRGGNVQIN